MYPFFYALIFSSLGIAIGTGFDTDKLTSPWIFLGWVIITVISGLVIKRLIALDFW